MTYNFSINYLDPQSLWEFSKHGCWSSVSDANDIAFSKNTTKWIFFSIEQINLYCNMNWQLSRMHFINASSAGTVQRIIPFLPYQRYKKMYQKRGNIYWEQTTRRWFLVCYNSIFTYLRYRFILQLLITKLLSFCRLGTWGVCFTYAAFFSIKGLVTAGRTYENSPSIRKACQFLLSKQLNTGGWGESHVSNETQVINFFL